MSKTPEPIFISVAEQCKTKQNAESIVVETPEAMQREFPPRVVSLMPEKQGVQETIPSFSLKSCQ